MSTVIVCPACKARYETKAVIPPEGRKVRCSKCGNVWQATAVTEAAAPSVAAPAAPSPARPAPAAPAPRAPAPPPRPPAAPGPQAAPAPRPAATMPPPSMTPPAAPAAKPTVSAPPAAPRPSPLSPNGGAPMAPPAMPMASDASFDPGEDFEADLADAVAGNTPGFWPGQTGPAAPAVEDTYQDLGSYKSGALVDPSLPQSPIPIRGESKRKVSPKVAIGWGILVLFLSILGALFALAPKTVVSVLPGASRLYAMMGKPVVTRPLDIQDVKYVWANAGGTQVLRVQGQIVNLSGKPADVPPVVVSLEDGSGNELSAATANLAPIKAGASSAFVVEIPTPPPSTKGLKVHFAKAG